MERYTLEGHEAYRKGQDENAAKEEEAHTARMEKKGWPFSFLTALLFTGRVFLHLRRNLTRVFLRASARPYSHNTATRMASKGVRPRPVAGAQLVASLTALDGLRMKPGGHSPQLVAKRSGVAAGYPPYVRKRRPMDRR